MEQGRETKDKGDLRKTQIITLADLDLFKSELLSEINKLLKSYAGLPTKQWLKSKEVRKLLNISHCTLQNMRSTGKLPFTRIGGVIYYDSKDLEEMLDKNKVNKSRKNNVSL